MQYLFRVYIIALILITLPSYVYAKNYKILDIPFDINIPDGWSVKTVLQDKKFFSNPLFKDKNFAAIKDNEIFLISIGKDISAHAFIDALQLDTVSSQKFLSYLIEEEKKTSSVMVLTSDIKNINNAKYFILSIQSNTTNDCIRNFYTIKNGKFICLTFIFNTKEDMINGYDENLDIIKSINFTKDDYMSQVKNDSVFSGAVIAILWTCGISFIIAIIVFVCKKLKKFL